MAGLHGGFHESSYKHGYSRVTIQEGEDMRLSDNSIASIAKLIQMAILTGTDVTDNLRLMRFTLNGDVIDPDQDFLKGLDDSINRMLETANELGNR
jgi:hypothetical protein